MIELLVVIAIIGILSSVVLASLNSARAKGQDAAIKSNLNNIRAAAELYYDSAGNTYSGLFGSTTVAAYKAIGQVTTAAGAAPEYYDSATQWAMESVLRTGQYYCVDSSGNATTTAASTIASGDIACN